MDLGDLGLNESNQVLNPGSRMTVNKAFLFPASTNQGDWGKGITWKDMIGELGLVAIWWWLLKLTDLESEALTRRWEIGLTGCQVV